MPVRSRPHDVLPTSEARRTLSQTARAFVEGGVNAEPVFFGAHRRPSGVMLSYARYLELLDRLDDLAIAARVSQRDQDDSGGRITLDAVLDEHGLNRSDLEAEVAREDNAKPSN
jgi:antitoxin StbD